MKKIIIISLFLLSGCAAPSSVALEVILDPDITITGAMVAEIVEKAKTDPESFEHCMRYDEVNVKLTSKEELALLEHCLGL